MRILVVEDEQIIAADLEAKLTTLGHEVVGTAVSGAEAIQMAEQFRPELALMDIQLRGNMSGIEAASEIQRLIGAQIICSNAAAGDLLEQALLKVPARNCPQCRAAQLKLDRCYQDTGCPCFNVQTSIPSFASFSDKASGVPVRAGNVP